MKAMFSGFCYMKESSITLLNLIFDTKSLPNVRPYTRFTDRVKCVITSRAAHTDTARPLLPYEKLTHR